MTILIVEHPIQEITESTCGRFNLNEIFSTNPEQNEKEMQNIKKEYDL